MLKYDNYIMFICKYGNHKLTTIILSIAYLVLKDRLVVYDLTNWHIRWTKHNCEFTT